MKLKNLAPIIAEQIQDKDAPERRLAYLSGNFPNADKTKDLNMRYRWDLLWSISAPSRRDFFNASDKANGNDTHIDTLLRSIVPDLKDAKPY